MPQYFLTAFHFFFFFRTLSHILPIARTINNCEIMPTYYLTDLLAYLHLIIRGSAKSQGRNFASYALRLLMPVSIKHVAVLINIAENLQLLVSADVYWRNKIRYHSQVRNCARRSFQAKLYLVRPCNAWRNLAWKSHF